MNIVTPIPTAVVFTTANVNTESARRDNVQRETIPQTSGLENSAAESAVGSESDRVRTAGQQQPVTYERPQPNQTQNAASQGTPQDRDNGDDPSAGRENAESRQQQQQERSEQQEVTELQARDREVRAHEQAHAAVGGQYAGSPQYEFETGPDGRQYAVGGEVSIDISEENTPEETIRKMQQVRAAALAPAEPSPQDLRVAGEATQIAAEARTELAQEQSEQAQQAFDRAFPENTPPGVQGEDNAEQTQNVAGRDNPQVGPELDDIVEEIGTGNPIRNLTEDPVAEAVGLETDAEQFRQLRESRDENILRRVGVIESFYDRVSQPRSFGLQQSA